MNPLKVYKEAHKRISIQIKELSGKGWRVKDGAFIPPKGHEAETWAAEWTPFLYENKRISIPHWLFNF